MESEGPLSEDPNPRCQHCVESAGHKYFLLLLLGSLHQGLGSFWWSRRHWETEHFVTKQLKNIAFSFQKVKFAGESGIVECKCLLVILQAVPAAVTLH